MKKYLFYILLFAFASCKKIINVDLNNAQAQVVIEGIVNDKNAATVILSKSVVFSSSNVFPAISGAIVTIKDNTGNTYALNEVSATKGTYSNNLLIGIPGRIYTMTVFAEGKTYTAISTMPAVVKFDTLQADEITFGNKNVKVGKPIYSDPAGLGNNYQFVETVNSRLVNNIFTWDDNVNDGGVNTRRLLYSDPVDSLNIKKGDTLQVEMRCIDKNIYNYMYALADLNGNQTTPANPDNNISNGALGYFSAHTSQKKKIIVP